MAAVLVALSTPVRASAGDSETLRLDWVWTSIQKRTTERGFVAADLDGDQRSELIAAFAVSPLVDVRGGYWSVLQYDEGVFNAVWTSTDFETGLAGIEYLAATNEIVAVGPDLVRIYSGASLEVVREFVRTPADTDDFSIVDLDSDGNLELVTCGYAGLEVIDFASGGVESTLPFAECRELAFGQLDEDSALEIAIAAFDAGTVIDGATLSIEWTDPFGFGTDLAAFDVNDDGVEELVAGWNENSGLRAFGLGGAPVWSIPEFDFGELSFVDVTGDGAPELLARSNWQVTALDPANGIELWTWWVTSGTPYGEALAAADVDGDGTIEVLVGPSPGSEYGIIAFDASTRTIEGESVNVGWRLESFGLGDIDGSGGSRVVMGPSGEFGLAGVESRLVIDLESRRQVAVWDLQNAESSEGAGTIAAQFDDDPALEVCFGEFLWFEDWHLYCQDGATTEIEWALDATATGKITALELDDDPQLELVASTSGPYLHAFEGESGWLKWRTPSIGFWNDEYLIALRLADFDGDGEREIAAASRSFWPGGRLVVFAAATGALVAGPFDTTEFRAIEAFELDGDAGEELLAVDAAGALVEVDVETGAVSPPIALLGEGEAAMTSGDVTRDGRDDLLVVAAGRLHVFDGEDLSLLWTSPFLGDDAGRYDTLYFGDFVGDGLPELLVGTGHGFVLLAVPAMPLFSDGFESGDLSAWSHSTP